MKPIAFVVGSGRCGTALLGQRFFPALNELKPVVDANHEYQCELVQEIGTKWHNGAANRPDVHNVIRRIYGAALNYTEYPLWLDCSNKASWIIGPLAEIFPQAKFVHLMRDGRKTCSSFYHKLAGECYTERAVIALWRWLDNPTRYNIPPLGKEWWWPMPFSGSPLAKQFMWKWGRFEQICWHWVEINRTIELSLENYVPADNRLFIRLEDLAGDGGETGQQLCQFLGLPWHKQYLPILEKRHNVIEPKDYELTPEQEKAFNEIAGEMQAKYYV